MCHWRNYTVLRFVCVGISLFHGPLARLVCQRRNTRPSSTKCVSIPGLQSKFVAFKSSTVVMAPAEYHATFSNSPNHGLQVGNNAGTIETHYYNSYPVGKLSLLHRNRAVCANLLYRASRDSTQSISINPIQARPGFCRPWDDSKSTSRPTCCTRILHSASRLRWCRVCKGI